MNPPFTYQQEILKDPSRIKIPCLGRQCGKTKMGAMAALEGHGPRSNGVPIFRGALRGATIYWVTKDYPTGTLIWRDLNSCLIRWSYSLDVSKADRRIGFPGGGSITIKSGSDPNAMRGPTVDGLVGDEVAFWHKDTLGAIEPALLVRRAWRLLLSSPYGFNFYHSEWQKGVVGDSRRIADTMSWRLPSSVSPLVSEEELARIKLGASPVVFAREYMAEFAVKTGEIFQSDWFRSFTHDVRYIYPEIGPTVLKEDLKVYLSADFALTKESRSDYTVVAVWGRAPDARLFLLDLIRGRYSASEVPALVKGIQDTWGATEVHVEKAGGLMDLNRECKVAGVLLREHTIQYVVDGKRGWDKVSRAHQGAAAIQRGRVMFPKVQQPDGTYAWALWVADLLDELLSFPTRGVHDDQVDAISWGIIAYPNTPGVQKPKIGVVGNTGDEDLKRSVYEEDAGDRRSGGWLIGR